MTAPASVARGGDIALASDVPNTLSQRIADRVDAKPDGIVRSYRDDGFHQARSRGALWQQAGNVAAALAAAGAVPSSVVVILAEDILDFLPASWACLRGGYVPVALMSAAREAAHREEPGFHRIMALLDNPVVIADDHFAALVARLPGLSAGRVIPLASVTPATWCDKPAILDPAWMVATSGSTGRPKLVALSTSAVLYRNFARGPVIDMPLPNALGTFPLDGVTGQHAAFLHYDNWTQISPHLLTVRPTAILDAIETCDISTFSVTTSLIRSLLAAEAVSGRTWRLGSLRLVGLGAEPILAGLVQDFAALIGRHGGDPGVLIAGYGTTETGSLVAGSRALLTSEPDLPVCLGRPWHGVSMRIVDEAGAVVPEGDVGELEVSCPAKMFSAYWGDPDATAAAFTADGWWKTGDLGQSIGGELTLRGRAKDVLILQGRKLSLADIDAEIQRKLGIGGVGHCYRFDATETQGEALGVAFDAGPEWTDAIAAAAIKTAIVRRFGIQPRRVAAIAADRIPRTAAGKVQRAALAALAAMPPDGAVQSVTSVIEAGAVSTKTPETVQRRLATIWCDVLGLDRAAGLEDGFFDLGGDSLRAVTLDLQIVEVFGIRVPSEAFFAEPDFGNLLRLVRQLVDAKTEMDRDATSDGGCAWPLPAAIRQGLSAALPHWAGERRSAHATITGHNIGGDLPPIFWVFNVPKEPAALAQALGRRQPLYAMRSGHQLIDYREDEIQAFALRYVHEIEQLCPTGPLFVAGNCQGGIIALAIAQHLLRRKRHIPLLVLLDWSFELQPYRGRVLLMAGTDNVFLNPRQLYARPELAWARVFAHHAFAEISGGYAEAFEAGHIGHLVRTLRQKMREAMTEPPITMPGSGYRATIRADNLPTQAEVQEHFVIEVSLKNDSNVVWAKTDRSGIVLSSRWMSPDGDRPLQRPQPSARVPGLLPLEIATVELEIVAPDTAGTFTLVVDLLEEGSRWFQSSTADAFSSQVQVVAKDSIWKRLSKRFG